MTSFLIKREFRSPAGKTDGFVVTCVCASIPMRLGVSGTLRLRRRAEFNFPLAVMSARLVVPGIYSG